MTPESRHVTPESRRRDSATGRSPGRGAAYGGPRAPTPRAPLGLFCGWLEFGIFSVLVWFIFSILLGYDYDSPTRVGFISAVVGGARCFRGGWMHVRHLSLVVWIGSRICVFLAT